MESLSGKSFSYEPGELGPFDLEVQIEFCGICHSDVHLVDDDWGMGHFRSFPDMRLSA